MLGSAAVYWQMQNGPPNVFACLWLRRYKL
jgi:hypothetical protein